MTPELLKSYGEMGGVFRLEDGRVIEVQHGEVIPSGTGWTMISANEQNSAWYRWREQPPHNTGDQQ